MKKSTTSTANSHGNENSSETSHVVYSKGSKHDANLQKNSFIYFQIGLIVAMLLVYFGLELGFNSLKPAIATNDVDLTETYEIHPEIYNFEVEKTVAVEKVQKAKPTETFEVVPDDFVELEKEFKNEPKEEAHVLKISDVKVAEDPNDEVPVIPFIALEDVPIFPGCEKVKKSERGACFEEKMKKHVKKNFRYPSAAIEMREQGRVSVMFTIGTQGDIEDVKLRGPSKILEKEASRIISKLPKMKPGMQRMEPVKVSFSLPIVFKLQ
ncbi:TonB family protein [Cellulophaga baltica]|uniref:energy transducer TonB n=1 Tax=Cellulophaga TaxID=104264 RepID=UPI001C06FF7E|nr:MULTISPECIES: energy transducer TonB [Cellulophaga]MBU2995206.1 TonB family protein [Cellulophaga baltica]MDO6766601.1 TonB family protein [Cellulophaga sp. 1_MG-2023]